MTFCTVLSYMYLVGGKGNDQRLSQSLDKSFCFLYSVCFTVQTYIHACTQFKEEHIFPKLSLFPSGNLLLKLLD